jgi:hypothetical protein
MNRHLGAGIAAGIAAPSTAVLVLGAWRAHAQANQVGSPGWQPPQASVVVAWAALFYSALAVLIYGLPVFLILRRLGVANLLTCILTALAPIAIAGFAGSMWGKNMWDKKMVPYGALFLLSGLSFWAFARKSITTKHLR